LALNKYDLYLKESQKLEESEAKPPEDTKKKEYAET